MWLELACEGERGEVTPLGFVADDERCRVTAFVPPGWKVLAAAARVAIEGVEGEATGNEVGYAGLQDEQTNKRPPSNVTTGRYSPARYCATPSKRTEIYLHK